MIKALLSELKDNIKYCGGTMEDIKAILLEQEEVLEYWNIIDPYVKQFLEHHGESTPFEIARNCIYGDYFTWLIVDKDNQVKGVAIAKVDIWPIGRYLHVVGLAGEDFKDWRDIIQHSFEKAARLTECEAITFCGRKGWSRSLKDFQGTYGETYHLTHVINKMDLKEIDEEELHEVWGKPKK